MRTESTAPSQYRLVRKQTGELVLQGLFSWADVDADGSPVNGRKWRDLPTVDEKAGVPIEEWDKR